MAKNPQNQAKKPKGNGQNGRDEKGRFAEFPEFLESIKKGAVSGVFSVHKKGQKEGHLF